MDVTSNFAGIVAVTICLLVSYWLLTSYTNRGLNPYPGPYLAKFTKLWHRMDVKSNKHQIHMINLHRRYGSIVRIGPNTLSLADPELVPLIYGVKNEFPKSDMYDSFAPRVNGKVAISILSVRNAKTHSSFKRPIANAYSLTALMGYEPLVDEMIQKFVNRIEETIENQVNGCIDMAIWLRLYAFDVIMHLTFSKTLGFLEAGSDVDGFMNALDQNLDHTALLLTMPWTAYLVKHNPIVGFFKKDYGIFPPWAAKQIKTRMVILDEKKDEQPGPKDFLNRFLSAKNPDGSAGPNFPFVMNWTLTNITAGADTTAIGLRAILYYLLIFPSTKEALLRELLAADLSYPVSWKESQRLPYLDACIKEALRLHPAVGFGLEREVPPAGLYLPDGNRLQPGTKVSMNAWVVNRQDIFGEQVDDFIPERWLKQDHESNMKYEERISKMKRADLTFGGGSRACMGRHISLLEIYKAIPTLLLRFDISLEDSSKEWSTINRWIVRQENIRCKVQRREPLLPLTT